MPPDPLPVPRFAAEPPQAAAPYGRWAERLGQEFLTACLGVDPGDDDLGEPGPLTWFPDRTWNGRTYMPVTSTTSTGFELFGYVSFAPGDGAGDEPGAFEAIADYTEDTAANNPDWRVDLSDEAVGAWRGPDGHRATMTLVWGVDLVGGAEMATAELGRLTVDQCPIVESRFTLLAPDDYRGDLLEVGLWDGRSRELARESVYVEDDEE